MVQTQRYRREIFIGIMLALAVLAVYLPVIWLDFTNYDDPAYVLENPPVLAGLTWPGAKWAFTHSHSGNWHPLTWLSHMGDCQLYELNPAGHHVTSALIHLANSLLVFGLLRGLTGAVWSSACVAALFALHPVHVESVAWIAERKDVLSGYFGLLSLWAYGEYAKSKVQSPKSKVGAPPSMTEGRATGVEPRKATSLCVRSRYVLAFVFLALGLMSKPMLVTWPCVMLLMDVWPLRRFALTPSEDPASPGLVSLLREKLPFFGLSAAACIITVISQKGASAIVTLSSAPLPARIANALLAYCRYLMKLVWPTKLSVIYLDDGRLPVALIVLAALGLAVASWLAWRLLDKRPWLLAGWAWYLGTLVPVIGLVKVGNQSMADRYLYLPAIGLFVILAWGVADLVKVDRRRRTVAALGAAILFSIYAVIAQQQVMLWQNTETLFRHTLAVSKINFVAQNSLGFYLADLGESEQAEGVLRASLAINPNIAAAWNKLGSVLINRGRYEEAAANCATALRLSPHMPEAHTTLALASLKQGKTNEALIQYTDALRAQPDYAPAHYNLANLLAHQGQFDQALEHYEASLRSDPRSIDAHNNLAYILAREQKFEEASGHFRIALHLRPQFWQAHYGLGDVLAKQGRPAEAAAEFADVLRLNPGLAIAHFQLALVLARQGKVTDALHAAGQARLLATQAGQEDLARRCLRFEEQLQGR